MERHLRPDRSVNTVAADIATLFGQGVVVETAAPALLLEQLFPAERTYIERAVPKRQAEFSTARACARRALSHLSITPCCLSPKADRSPAWPPGVVGSITHTASLCAVAVANSQTVRAVGIDAEQATPLKAELEKMICTPQEQRWISQRFPHHRREWSKLFFSAKEAFFKCPYPLSQTFLDFLEVELEIAPDSQSFRVKVLKPLAFPFTDSTQGRWMYRDGLVLTTSIVRRAEGILCS